MLIYYKMKVFLCLSLRVSLALHLELSVWENGLELKPKWRKEKEKRDFLVVNGRELEKRQEERARETVFAQVKEKWLEGYYFSGK